MNEMNEIKSRYATKKKGKTEVYPLKTSEDIFNIMSWFRDNKEWDGFLITCFGILLGRRIGDTLSFKWSDFFFKNGTRRESISTVEEQKTGKTLDVPISNMVFNMIEEYCKETGIDPMEHYNEFIFNCNSKTEWQLRSNDKIYKSNDLDDICDHLGKQFGPNRKSDIINDFENQRKHKTLGEYFYNEVEYMDVIKWQSDEYRKKLSMAVKSADITYRVSTHTLRKTYGAWIMKENPYDPMAIYGVQRMLGHSSIQTTESYIGLSRERDKLYAARHGETMGKVFSGDFSAMENKSPVVSIKNNDLRDVIMYVINNKDKDAMELMAEAMNLVEQKMIKGV